jgi:ureidoacrylate peracid hydrolase
MKNYLLFIVSILFLCYCSNNKKESSSNVLTTKKTSLENKSGNKQIRFFAKPDSISIDVEKTAVIVVDMQNDFGSKGGMFDRAGIDISMIQKTIVPAENVLATARKEGIKIIYLKMGYQPNLTDLGTEGTPNRMRHLQIMHVGDTINAPDGRISRILIRDSWGTDIVPQLKPQADDIILYKTRFSGFYQTALDSLLKKLNKKHLIVIGCTTSICVESTVRDAMFRDYLPIVLEDCTAEPLGYGLPRSNHDASLLNIQALLGWISNSGEFIKAANESLITTSTESK